jgi:hypothetical protein
MKISLNTYDLTEDGGLEIGVEGFKGDPGIRPSQVFIEYYGTEGRRKKLRIHVWDGTSEDPVTFEPAVLGLADIVTGT